ncbi:hypothetical protein FNV43_RR03942 [Rhamnella rubrinervis]|uniref:FBD domain-containing protein n=1 Tax=Rhamnella rubrinervis TaxID=2594499 RepID=A0A8K0MPB9_9ROSA|nr:hypothetical protein FNV43_RR03942 [Rhamnella rubrinervis]
MAEQVDMFEKLSDESIIFIIISSLPFKEAARTCILSKRWRHLWRATKTIEFNERFFVKGDVDSQANREIQRKVFVDFVIEWINHYIEPVVDNLYLTFSRPRESLTVIENCIKFALARNVKSLGFDFTDPAWHGHDLDSRPQESFDLPSYVYEHQAVESLTLFSCKFSVSGVCNLRLLRQLSLGWVGVRQSSLKVLLENCGVLESLSLKRCWGIGRIIQIEGKNLKLKTLVIDQCRFVDNYLAIFEAPKLRVFKYSGKVANFDIQLSTSILADVDLDFGYENEFSEFGDILHNLLCYLNPMTVLTVCSYLLQVIPSGEQELCTKPSLDVAHLKLKTALHDNEFWGIKYMLKSCPRLNTLTIEMSSDQSRILPDYDPPSTQSWKESFIGYKCLRNKLKVVQIKGFKGNYNELYLVDYVLYFGRVMENLNIYISKEVDVNGNGSPQVYLSRARQILQFKRTSPRLQISILI